MEAAATGSKAPGRPLRLRVTHDGRPPGLGSLIQS